MYVVHVQDQNGKPMEPTTRFGKVRRMLKEGKARVVRRKPFTIRLLYEPETRVVRDYMGTPTADAQTSGTASLT